MKIESKQTHCGQLRPYGDFIREWEITTDSEDRNEVLEYCFTSLYNHRVPEKAKYMKDIRFGTGEKSGDANYYFAGYHELIKTDYGYKFIIHEPFAD